MSNQPLNTAPDLVDVFLRVDLEQDCIEINGVRYSIRFFTVMSEHVDETAFYRLRKREDGVITIEKIERERAKLSDPIHQIVRETSQRSPA